QY
ncbi:hypothetical protein CP8484711_1262B, partial [Chlamydia psittaci 84-8471/1]